MVFFSRKMYLSFLSKMKQLYFDKVVILKRIQFARKAVILD